MPPVYCPACGATIPDGARFCSSCGARADSASPDVTATSTSDAQRFGVPHVPAGAAVRSGPSSGWLAGSESIDHGRFAPGAIFDGRYRIIGLLGRGGMGEVYRADDLRLGQPVALKLLPEDLRDDPVRLAQFHNEVRTARQVSHPNVCRVYDIGEGGGILYLTMEYVDGEDLSSSLRRIGRFPEDKAIDVARQLCAGVAAAHQRGVIHRDLKPANVMLDGAGRVRIMDFGLATAGRVEDVRAGTPAYMAPEQLLGREVTAKSDIFALGLVIYELFTGKRAFTAATIAELVEQHQSRGIVPPSGALPGIDPAVERAIMRCLDPEPGRRPGSALAISASLPGGDPLAAALAAGETPSPEMVVAAGEGAALSPRFAWSVFLAVIVGMAVWFALARRVNSLETMRPELSGEVLAQKAREALARIGYPARTRDAAYGFFWDGDLGEHVQREDKPAPRWHDVAVRRPSLLGFWYRQSPQPLTALAFHSDLLIPGIVDRADPPPVVSGMTHVELDYKGRLTFFEAIPPQRQEAFAAPGPADWGPLFALADIDLAGLTPAEPLWNWLAAADTRAAWTGVWPESGRPLRVEAAALGGRPVAFMAAGPWRKPWRMPEDSEGGSTATILVLVGLAIFILGGSALLASRNLRGGRGDLRGAGRLAISMTAVLLGLWLCQVHLAASVGLLAMFLLAVCTSAFYGVLLWTMYVALEPFVRRYWPQVLVSLTTVLSGRLRDPVVGRDVLAGAALGVAWALMIRTSGLLTSGASFADVPGELEVLKSVRGSFGAILEAAPYAVRNVFLYFFLLFVLRVLLRSERLAAFAFVSAFTLLSLATEEQHRLMNAAVVLLFLGSGVFVLLRWGLLSYVLAMFVVELLMRALPTLDVSAPYFANAMLVLAMPLALTGWGLYTSLAPRSR
jgi:serine/threonine-protein kinase